MKLFDLIGKKEQLTRVKGTVEECLYGLEAEGGTGLILFDQINKKIYHIFKYSYLLLPEIKVFDINDIQAKESSIVYKNTIVNSDTGNIDIIFEIDTLPGEENLSVARTIDNVDPFDYCPSDDDSDVSIYTNIGEKIKFTNIIENANKPFFTIHNEIRIICKKKK